MNNENNFNQEVSNNEINNFNNANDNLENIQVPTEETLSYDNNDNVNYGSYQNIENNVEQVVVPSVNYNTVNQETVYEQTPIEEVTASEPVIDTQVYEPVEAVQQEEQETPEEIVPTGDNNNNNNNGGKGKTILLILFFIFAITFVIFLPNIREMMTTGNNNSNKSEVDNGTLTCEMDTSSDETKTIYEYRLKFTNKKLTTSTLNTTVESESNKTIEEKNKSCLHIEEISKNITGIDITCTSSDNISTIIQNNNYKIIDNNNLTAFTEAGGVYPEYKYKENIYNIESALVKAGYNCKITAE